MINFIEMIKRKDKIKNLKEKFYSLNGDNHIEKKFSRLNLGFFSFNALMTFIFYQMPQFITEYSNSLQPDYAEAFISLTFIFSILFIIFYNILLLNIFCENTKTTCQRYGYQNLFKINKKILDLEKNLIVTFFLLSFIILFFNYQYSLIFLSSAFFIYSLIKIYVTKSMIINRYVFKNKIVNKIEKEWREEELEYEKMFLKIIKDDELIASIIESLKEKEYSKLELKYIEHLISEYKKFKSIKENDKKEKAFLKSEIIKIYERINEIELKEKNKENILITN